MAHPMLNMLRGIYADRTVSVPAVVRLDAGGSVVCRARMGNRDARHDLGEGMSPAMAMTRTGKVLQEVVPILLAGDVLEILPNDRGGEGKYKLVSNPQSINHDMEWLLDIPDRV